MNKCTELSDFEINQKVAECLGVEWFVTSTIWDELVVIVNGKHFKPCNNPADAMPIIIENKIAMNHPYDIWQCGSGWNVAENKNPLRACMESYLLMKDAENEG
ncbi:phage protein NinX family protein [Providencia alcalifaciens]|uniref:phage protein NinX family protein n=1 Tax=Providencia alcalifaciens TaxID=126385 RepID=UPI0032DAB361